VGAAARIAVCLTGLLLWLPVNAFSMAGLVVAAAAALGILFIAFEIAVSRRSASDSGEHNNA
jgi:hypothetical protein